MTKEYDNWGHEEVVEKPVEPPTQIGFNLKSTPVKTASTLLLPDKEEDTVSKYATLEEIVRLYPRQVAAFITECGFSKQEVLDATKIISDEDW